MNLPPLGVAAATFRMKSVTGQKSRKRKR
jgi:hypothetical protein